MSLVSERREGMGGPIIDFDELRQLVKQYPDPSLDAAEARQGNEVPNYKYERRLKTEKGLGSVATVEHIEEYRSGPDFPGDIPFTD